MFPRDYFAKEYYGSDYWGLAQANAASRALRQVRLRNLDDPFEWLFVVIEAFLEEEG